MAVIEGNTGSVRRSPHAIKFLKRVNFMLSKTQPAVESERERRARKCRIPAFPPRRRVAETRFDCRPRPRTPFLLVSAAALALAERRGGDSAQRCNLQLPPGRKARKASPLSGPKGADCEMQLRGANSAAISAQIDCLLCQLRC